MACSQHPEPPGDPQAQPIAATPVFLSFPTLAMGRRAREEEVSSMVRDGR